MVNVRRRDEIRTNRITLRNAVRDSTTFNMTGVSTCIIGHAREAFEFEDHYETIDNLPEVLGLTKPEIKNLCWPMSWITRGARPQSQAIDVLTQIIETGTFKWPDPVNV